MSGSASLVKANIQVIKVTLAVFHLLTSGLAVVARVNMLWHMHNVSGVPATDIGISLDGVAEHALHVANFSGIPSTGVRLGTSGKTET